MKYMCLNGPQNVKPDRGERCPAFKLDNNRFAFNKPKVRSCTYCDKCIGYQPHSDGSVPLFVQEMIEEFRGNIHVEFREVLDFDQSTIV